MQQIRHLTVTGLRQSDNSRVRRANAEPAVWAVDSNPTMATEQMRNRPGAATKFRRKVWIAQTAQKGQGRQLVPK